MRQRRVKNETEKVLSYSDYLVLNPEKVKGQWNKYMGNDHEIHIEIGCGRGKFISTLAEINPNINYIGIELIGSVILRALEKAEANNFKNLLFLWKQANLLEDFFDENEINTIYLNFSDPWPKDRHAKRRLTHGNFLAKYKKILKPGGSIEFKTDNLDLFVFSLQEFEASGYIIKEMTNDLYHSHLISDNIATEYEEKFIGLGKKINYCKVITK